jgi:acyl carrier protein
MNSDKIITKKVCEIVILNMGLNADVEVLPTTTFAEDLECDSLDTVEIIMCLEEEFDIELDESEFNEESTVQFAIDLIKKELDDE